MANLHSTGSGPPPQEESSWTELVIPPGWVLGNAACFDDNGGGGVGTWDNVDTITGIDLAPGDSVTCTFTNQAVGTVMLAKNSIGGDGSFGFVTDVPGLGTNIQTSGGSGNATPATNVPTGTYSIAETVPTGWVLDSATCSNGSPPDALVLTLNETVTCTFTNTKLGEPPEADDDAYDAFEDTPLNIAAPGVLSNDSDADGDPLTAVEDSTTGNGSLTLNSDGSFDYTPDPNYCGPDGFTYHANDGTVDSNVATVDITVNCVNDAPVAVNNNYTHDEDTQLVGNVITDDTGEGLDSDVDVGDSLSMFSNTDVSHGTLVINADASGAFRYDPNDDYCGTDSFTYVITDNPSTTPESLTSNTATVAITVTCVNDPPTLTSVTPGTQTAAYSDYIGTVTVEVNDVDDTSTTLAATNQPTLSEAGGMGLSSASCVPYDPESESPAENGSTCTWTYTGQVLDPGDNVHAILFTASDGDGAGSVTGTHTLTIVPEEATVVLDSGNDVAVQVEDDGGDSGLITLHFSATETNNPDNPHDGTAEFGDLNEMVPFMTLVPVGPGGPISADSCAFIAPLPVYTGEGYGQVALFECTFNAVPVNTYVVEALVDGSSDTTRYYTGADDAVLVIFDPSLGFTTGGGWFYWPETANLELLACGEDGYAGDKTNFGFNMKYNKKRTNVQGSLLMMRHTVDANCEGAGKYRVKSNALDGLSIGDDTDADGDYGWAAFSGKSVFSEPGLDGSGNHPFLVYVEDHSDEGGNQDPADEFWIQVRDKDGNVVLETNGPDSDPAGEDGEDGDDVSIENGNIIVPHSGGKGGKK